MEKEVRIPIPGTKKVIHGKLHGTYTVPVVLFVHGLMGHMDDSLFSQAAPYFKKRGFSSLRFNLYDHAPNARTLDECTLSTHANDLDCVVDYVLKNGASLVFVVGHSYGGPVIVCSQKQRFTGAVLWDPSYNLSKTLLSEFLHPTVKANGYFVFRDSFSFLLSRAFITEDTQFAKEAKTIIASFVKPLYVLAAGKGALVAESKQYYKWASGEKKFALIQGADHSFTERNSAERLYEKTVAWLEKISRQANV